jgi:tetratricopeptide (TPR) repeat protein
MGQCVKGRGFTEEYDKEIANLTEAIRLNPDDAGAYYNRGDAYSERDGDDQAIADFTKAIRLDSDYIEAYYQRGLSYFQKGDYDRAIADFTTIIRLYPDDHN